MTCQYSPCNFCNRLIRSTSVAVTGSSSGQKLTITIPNTTLINLDSYCLVVCQSIPTNASNLPVVITNGSTTLPMLCRKGNTLRADQIRSRRKYKVVYGNDTPHILVESCVCPTSYVVPTTTTKPTTDTESSSTVSTTTANTNEK